MSTHSDQPSLASSVNGYSSYGNNRHTHAPNQNHQGHPAFAHDNNNRHHDAASNLLSMHGQGHGATPNANDNFAPPNHRYQYSQQTPHPPARQAMNGYPQTNVQGLLPHPSPLHDDNLPTPNDESVLEYPHDFFDAKGNLPKDAEAAKSKWKYRKSRPKHRSVCDDEPEPPTTADGEAMLTEMKDIRASLQKYIKLAFHAEAKKQAAAFNLVMPDTGELPSTPKDFVSALSALKRRVDSSVTFERRNDNTFDDEVKAYMVCHHFNKGRHWVATQVDDWLKKQNMVFVKPNKDMAPMEGLNGKRIVPRVNQDDRGGFGAVANATKSELTKTLMRNMFSKAKWSVAGRLNKSTHSHQYTQVTYIRTPGRTTENVQFYVVTPSSNQNGDEATSASRSAPGSNASTPIDLIDYTKYLAEQLNLNIPEEQLQSLKSTYRPVDSMIGLGVYHDNESASELTEENSTAVPRSSFTQQVSSATSNESSNSDFDIHVYQGSNNLATVPENTSDTPPYLSTFSATGRPNESFTNNNFAAPAHAVTASTNTTVAPNPNAPTNTAESEANTPSATGPQNGTFPNNNTAAPAHAVTASTNTTVAPKPKAPSTTAAIQRQVSGDIYTQICLFNLMILTLYYCRAISIMHNQKSPDKISASTFDVLFISRIRRPLRIEHC